MDTFTSIVNTLFYELANLSISNKRSVIFNRNRSPSVYVSHSVEKVRETTRAVLQAKWPEKEIRIELIPIGG